MNEKSLSFLVDKKALPEVLLKTVYAKELLDTKKVSTVSEAVKKADISRSAFYKYKDLIRPFYDSQQGKKITFLLVVLDITGVLSSILSVLTKSSANILTINQNIPINGMANITITIDTLNSVKIEKLEKRLISIEGVKKLDIISNE